LLHPSLTSALQLFREFRERVPKHDSGIMKTPYHMFFRIAGQFSAFTMSSTHWSQVCSASTVLHSSHNEQRGELHWTLQSPPSSTSAAHRSTLHEGRRTLCAKADSSSMAASLLHPSLTSALQLFREFRERVPKHDSGILKTPYHMLFWIAGQFSAFTMSSTHGTQVCSASTVLHSSHNEHRGELHWTLQSPP